MTDTAMVQVIDIAALCVPCVGSAHCWAESDQGGGLANWKARLRDPRGENRRPTEALVPITHTFRPDISGAGYNFWHQDFRGIA